MFGKLRTVHWLAIVAALAAIWWWSGRSSPRAQQRTFRDRLLQVDTAALSEFTLEPAPFKGLPPIHFRRGTLGWWMRMESDSSAVESDAIRDVLGSLADMRTIQLAGQVAAVGTRYDLTDSTADRLILRTTARTIELWVGAGGQSDKPTTAVRLPQELQVYTVAGRLGDAADRTFGGWLPKRLVVGDPQNWTRLTFRFPNDSSYTMERDGAQWTIAGLRTDSARTWRYLQSLARARGQEAGDPRDTLLAIPGYRVTVEDTTRKDPIMVTVYLVPQEQRFIVRSSLHPQVVMPFDPRTEIPRMFRPPDSFMQPTS
jgi:hypothetical protein